MKSAFEKQLGIRSGSSSSARPPFVARDQAASPIPRRIFDKYVLNRMLEHKTQGAFLKALVAYEEGEVSMRLRESLGKADRERRYLRRAAFILAILLMLTIAGLGYCAILLPQVFANPDQTVIKILGIVGLASLIAQLEIYVYLLWHRHTVDRLHRECRRRILLLVESQIGTIVPPGHGPGDEAR